jgi:hypothetical protein
MGATVINQETLVGVAQKFHFQLTIKIGEGQKTLYIWARRFPEYYQ